MATATEYERGRARIECEDGSTYEAVLDASGWTVRDTERSDPHADELETALEAL